MEITEVRISLREDAKLKAFASMTFDDCFVIRGLKLIEGNSGMFVAMPNRKRPDGSFQDIAHPINHAMRRKIEQLLIERYKEAVSRGEDSRFAEVF
jgi:stage V sporulation protein G